MKQKRYSEYLLPKQVYKFELGTIDAITRILCKSLPYIAHELSFEEYDSIISFCCDNKPYRTKPIKFKKV